MSSFFFGRLTDWVLRRRGAVAVLIVLLTAFFLWKMQDLQFDNSNEIWFSEGDPSLERINTFHKLFGNDDFVYLVFDADTLFSPESLRLLSDLVSDIRKKVPYLRDVTWLGNAERIEADAGLDVGLTLIGMHLRRVAVPVRLKTDRIGRAIVTAARTRPKLIGGERARYAAPEASGGEAPGGR